MPKGIIRFFNESRGYGFIQSEDGPGQSPSPGVYVHHSKIADDGYRTLREGDSVAYDVQDGQYGPEAVNVQRLP